MEPAHNAYTPAAHGSGSTGTKTRSGASSSGGGNMFRARLAQIRKRMAGNAGFSFVEVLVALAITALLGGIVVNGVNVASKVYVQTNYASQSELLASTINNALSEPIRYMDVKSGTITINGQALKDAKIVVKQGSQDSKALLYIAGTNSSGDTAEIRLLNEGIYGDCNIALKGTGEIPISKDGVEGNYTITSTSNATLSNDYSFYYKPVSGVQRL